MGRRMRPQGSLECPINVWLGIMDRVQESTDAIPIPIQIAGRGKGVQL
jgi:hypothetical protein